MATPGSARWRARWMLVGFVVTVLATRTITTVLHLRGAGAEGGLVVGGVHLHHMVFGLALLAVLVGAWILGARWAAPHARPPWMPVLLGVAWALILDELALIINLQDVYWAPLGDESLIGIGALVAGLLLASALAPDRVAAQD